MNTIRLQGTTLDRRRKLTEENKREIREWHRQGASIHSISKFAMVSRRLIQFILFPERHVKNLADRAANGGSKRFYVREKHKIYMRRHRAHVREVVKIMEGDL